MVMSLEEYVAQATNAYQPSSNAVQSQIDALSGQLEATNQQINKNYANQQAQLDRSKNQAASTASMQAAGSGGSFGGASNIANRKYYAQTFVPAQTTLQTNQANELASARQASEDQRTSLNSQLANIQAQANQQALAQYYSDLEAEKTRENNLAVANAQNAASNAYYQYLMDAANAQDAATTSSSNTSSGLKNWDFGNGYSIQEDSNGNAIYVKDGSQITAGDFLAGTAKNSSWDVWNDIWNNGVSTNGVGSDTVQYYKSSSNPNAIGSSKYQNRFSYLYK